MQSKKKTVLVLGTESYIKQYLLIIRHEKIRNYSYNAAR